jgi:hypothetical protein
MQESQCLAPADGDPRGLSGEEHLYFGSHTLQLLLESAQVFFWSDGCNPCDGMPANLVKFCVGDVMRIRFFVALRTPPISNWLATHLMRPPVG